MPANQKLSHCSTFWPAKRQLAVMSAEEATVVLSGIGTELSDGMLMNICTRALTRYALADRSSSSTSTTRSRPWRPPTAPWCTARRSRSRCNASSRRPRSRVEASLLESAARATPASTGTKCTVVRVIGADWCVASLRRYYHVTDNAAFAATAPPVAKAAKTPREPKKKAPKPVEPAVVPPEVQAIPGTQICRHFSKGFCSQGSACKFAHVLGRKSEAPVPTGKVAQICHFYQSGLCTRGDECRFVHQPKPDATPEESVETKASALSESSGEESEDEGKTEQNEQNRTCVECEKPGVAVWKCAKCDNSLYCDDCNSAVHSARVMAEHKHAKLPPAPKLSRCGECESNTASVRCEQCDVPFCDSCDASVHKFKSLRKHTRVKLSAKSEKTKTKTKVEEPKVAKPKEKKTAKAAEPAPKAKVVDPVEYVESVPQLEFSSESESSESEDEEMAEALPVQPTVKSKVSDDDDELMPAADSESEEDFDDVKPQSAVPVTPAPVVENESHESESEEDFEDKPAAKSAAPATSVPKMELSSDSSDSSDEEASEPVRKAKESSDFETESEDEASSKPASKPVSVSKPTLAELSSESESDSDDEAPSKPARKLSPKPASKLAPAKPSSESSDSEDETPSKPAPASKPVAKKAASSSSSSESSDSSSSDSSDSSEDEAPPAKPAAKPTPASRRAPVPARNNKAGGISEGSSHTLVKKIEAFNESGEGDELHLDANLNGFERLLAHDCAERLGLGHESIGAGLERHIIISRQSAKRPAANSGNARKSKKSKHH
ncbi:unnamed protein product [Phytophthora lilii]|uniref:Unnamed protein product n=1 Tax=Phytophthora lilii TaxID=2077276 RepID=A0A9W6THI9_9STRA|nr:unnamed protein product [Phytophthora lilii]